MYKYIHIRVFLHACSEKLEMAGFLFLTRCTCPKFLEHFSFLGLKKKQKVDELSCYLCYLNE